MRNGTPCFDPTCDCCLAYGAICRDYEEQIARLRGPATPNFKGVAYRNAEDGERLADQFERVWEIMRDGRSHTIAEVAERTGDPAHSVARQIRYIRGAARGSHVVEREHLGRGLHAYRVDFDAKRGDEGQIGLFDR